MLSLSRNWNDLLMRPRVLTALLTCSSICLENISGQCPQAHQGPSPPLKRLRSLSPLFHVFSCYRHVLGYFTPGGLLYSCLHWSTITSSLPSQSSCPSLVVAWPYSLNFSKDFCVVCIHFTWHILFTMSGKSLIKTTKSTGPSTLPWGTPLVKANQSEYVPFTHTLWRLPSKGSLIHDNTLDWIPWLEKKTMVWHRIKCLWKV